MIIFRLTERVVNLEAENDKLTSELKVCKLAIDKVTTESKQKDFHVKAMAGSLLVMTEKLEKMIKELKETPREKNCVISQMSTQATNSSNSSYGCSENAPKKWSHYSHLQSVKDVHQEAANITKTYIYSMSHLPAQCEEWFTGDVETAQTHLQSMAWKAFDAMVFLLSETTARENMGKIRASFWDIYDELKVTFSRDNTPPDLSKHSCDCVRLVKLMIETFETFNFMATSFQDIVTFSKYFTSLVGFLNSHADDKVTERYEMGMQELILRSAEIQ